MDITLGETHDLKFETTVNGVPTTLAGTPTVAAYIDNGTTELTAGLTLTADFDGRAGLHNVRIAATSANGYAAGTNVQIVLTAGTVGGDSVVGRIVGAINIERELADSIPADGTRPTMRQALYMLTQFMLERSVSSTTVTVRKTDGSTALFTLTLDNATTPTSITRAS